MKLSRRCGDWFENIRLAQIQASPGTILHQSMGNTLQFLYPSRTTDAKLLCRTCLIVVIDREGLSEKILFYSLKIQFHPIAGHKIRDGVRRGFAAHVLRLPIHRANTDREIRDVLDNFCLHLRVVSCITVNT